MTSPSPLLPDTFYHIYNRGVNGENIFREERNYLYFLQLYAKHIEPVAETYSYCLMPNHFHVLLCTKPESTFSKQTPSQGFSNCFAAYAKAINKAYQRSGSLFEHPFGRVAITSDLQFWRVIRYIHHNPQKHHFSSDFRQWQHSSYRPILSGQPTRLMREQVLEWFGGREEYLRLHEEWSQEADGGLTQDGDR